MDAMEGNHTQTQSEAIFAKLRRLPMRLLLALIDATAVLVIVAAIVALVAITRANNFAGNLAATMTEAALSKIDLPSREVLANLRNLTTEIRALGNSLREAREREDPMLRSEVARLKEALSTLSTNINRLTSAKTILTDEAIGQLARSASDALMKMKGCAPSADHVQPDRGRARS
jgi:flagellar motility protein MotE (MotC chaperone)